MWSDSDLTLDPFRYMLLRKMAICSTAGTNVTLTSRQLLGLVDRVCR